MSDATCDECGEQPYAVETMDGNYEIWCECLDGPHYAQIEFQNGHPQYWGENGDPSFICYECGSIPRLSWWVGTHGSSNRNLMNPRLNCNCTRSIRIGWRSLVPDKWKDDMDPKKWDDLVPEIVSDLKHDVDELSEQDLIDRYDISEAEAQCHWIHTQRQTDIRRMDTNGEAVLVHAMSSIETESGGGSDPDETGHRSGKGTGWFSKWLLGWRNE